MPGARGTIPQLRRRGHSGCVTTVTAWKQRLGHSSTRAAMIYQHATRDRDQVIAKTLGGLARQTRILGQDQADNG